MLIKLNSFSRVIIDTDTNYEEVDTVLKRSTNTLNREILITFISIYLRVHAHVYMTTCRPVRRLLHALSSTWACIVKSYLL